MDLSLSPNFVPDQALAPVNRSANRGWRWWCRISLLVWGLCATLARSEDGFKSGEQGVLLIENNRIVAGRIIPQGDSYAVEQAAGTLIIAKEKVLHVGANLRSAYVHLQDALPKKPKADDHVELARWCVSYKLMSEARFELEAALEADPNREDIRRNLTKLEALLNRPPTVREPVKAETPAERFAKGTSMYDPEVESLGGLSREAGQEYTRKIQPILMHNCTASACHGPLSDNKLKLTLVRLGTGVMRSTTEKNLLALLPYIDRESPRSGKLWKLLKTNHGAKGSSIFLGTRGKDQLSTVQDWLLSLSTEEESDPVENPFAAQNPAANRSAGTKPSSPKQAPAHSTDEQPRWRKGGPAVRPVPDEVSPRNSRIVQTAARTTSEPHMPDAPNTGLKSSGSRTAGSQITGSRTTQRSVSAHSGASSDEAGPDVEPIVSEVPPGEIADLPPEDPFNPDEFNRRQKVKRSTGP